MSRRYQVIDPDVRQPLPDTAPNDYQEHLFLDPSQSLTSFNSDNYCRFVGLIDPNNENHTYSNAALTGQAHPRTRIAPIITVRPLDTGGPDNTVYWRDNAMSSLSILNKRKKQYPALAGYNTEELTALHCLQPELRQPLGGQTMASPLVQTIQPGVYTLPTTYDPINTDFNIDEATYFEPVKQDRPRGNVIFRPVTPPPEPEPEPDNTDVEENYEPISKSASAKQKPEGKKKASPEPAGEKKKSPEPERKSKPKPVPGRQAGVSAYQNPPLEDDVSIYNVFDPRFAGYGSDDRNYTEPTLRQTRYFYDDVDAIRRPNYIVRSKIDSCVTPFGDGYGPMRVDQRTLNQNRPLAEQAYLNQNLNFRNDMMESLMRKINSERWQTRAAPKYTTRQSLK